MKRLATGVAPLVLVTLVMASDVARAQTPSAETPGTSDQATSSSQAPRPVPSTRLTWAVTERVRYSGLFNQFRPGLAGDYRAVVFRTTVKAEFAWPRATLGGEVQDVRAYLISEKSNVSTALVNAVDLLQAYVLLGRATPATARLPEVQIGRFTMELGSGRLVAQEAYRDVARTFTGAKLTWPGIVSGAVTAFAVLPVVTMPDGRADLLQNRIAPDSEHLNQKFWGALYERKHLWRRTGGEVYFYALDEHDDPGQRETRDRKLWTAGVRLLRPAAAGAWDVDVESAWQGGCARASSAAPYAWRRTRLVKAPPPPSFTAM